MEEQVKVGDTVEVEVFKITNFGAFVKLPANQRGLIHISQVSDNYVKDINEHMRIGDRVKARVLQIEDGKIDLTLKREKPPMNSFPRGKEFRSSDIEDKIKRFLKKSEERQSDLRRNIEAKRK